MIASIVRASVTIARSTEGDQTWLYGWAGIEMGVGMYHSHLSQYPPSQHCTINYFVLVEILYLNYIPKLARYHFITPY